MVWSIGGSDSISCSVQGESAAHVAEADPFSPESDDRSAPEGSPQLLPDAESLEPDRPYRTALVVVAQPDLMKIVAEALARLNVRVSLESQADRALQAIAVQRFDLILVDIDLQPTGWKVVQAIRSRLFAPPWPLILLAAPDTVVDGQREVVAEPSACLRKPVTVDELESTAASMLRRWRSRWQPGRTGSRLEGCSGAKGSQAQIEPEGAESMTDSLKVG